jgi:hypothetical protein
MDLLGEGESIFEGALDLGKEGGCQTSKPFDQTSFIDGFVSCPTNSEHDFRSDKLECLTVLV